MKRNPLHFMLVCHAVWLSLGVLGPACAADPQPTVDEPLPPLMAAETMQVPAGFQVSLFAGEPFVKQPIAMCIDDRGRLWVAEAYSYPIHTAEAKADRILIFEDTDGDGRFDKRQVFYDRLNYVTGIEVGFGGAWVMSPPHLYFIPDGNGDDQPDGPPEVVLDGFGNHANSHNLANGFSWGPDGWLYGTHGRTNWSMIGKPGTPDNERARFDGGVYRYHPVRKVWEPYVDGCTNPWGIDWDDYGQAFIPNTVDPHLFHATEGAHYEPWRNRESSRFAYERITTIADHLHFVGGSNVRSGLGSPAEDALGGGHSHCGIMVYLGGSWPAEYRNTVFMHNTHGRRINRDILHRSGSGYSASHGPDFLRSQDPWFMGVSLRYGPDGSAYATDWSDTGECHSVRNTRRQTGRIFKISYGRPKFEPVNVATQSNDQLVEWQLHTNDWFVRHARRVLQERMAAGIEMTGVHQALHEMLATHPDITRQLRALWALHVTGGLDDEFLLKQLSHPNEHLRAWAVRLLCEDRTPSAQARARFRELAAEGSSPLVRLHLASALQRLATSQRWGIAEALIARAEDQDDQNLPLMEWYAIEPLVHVDLARFAGLARTAQIPLIQRHIARRIASLPEPQAGLSALVPVLIDAPSSTRRELLAGMLIGLTGRRGLTTPDNWNQVAHALSKDKTYYQQALELGLLFNDPEAIVGLRGLATDTAATAEVRTRAVQHLVQSRPKQLDAWLIEQLNDKVLQRSVLRGLAQYDHPQTAPTILRAYSTLDGTSARQDALQTLAARPAWAAALLDAVERKEIAASELTAYTVRQIANLGSEQLNGRITKLWGRVRPTSQEKQALVAKFRKDLDRSLAGADPSAGRATFHKTCAACHKLFGTGGDRGPDITGAQRKNLDYLLENLIDPSASVARDYQMRIMVLDSGRTLTGLVGAETETTLTLRTLNEDLVIPKSEIEQTVVSPLSMMPEKILEQMSSQQVRDLFRYLQSPQQVPLPPGFDAAEKAAGENSQRKPGGQ